MHTADLYDYAILRAVPRVEREEFINVGVLLSCPSQRLLLARVGVDAARLRALDPDVDVELVERQLQAIVAICEGRPGSGPIGELPIRARFHWLTAKRSALIQPSPVHTGQCGDPLHTIDRLFDRMVRTG
ncbi:DUF3037 domain-containing protein [Lysobacter sp. TY2-98]|uniref:DUF3037 domain-containing protein n=1 Tax=Lysobacter sp. TY2-98 TaxID=2290922 RepID=UPI000E2060AC|nr:DUF3037 domain-containing protein [Lysobacter sp. TY2-98]AXK72811.1 DUF3037 domain-containing protein [Lysobacter sp. TY2-98]